MEISQTYLKKFEVKKGNPNQILADEIWRYFGKRLPFPRIMRIISEKGAIWTRETFNEIRKGDAKDHLALFIWKVRECQIIRM